jgi:hypothetical protein
MNTNSVYEQRFIDVNKKAGEELIFCKLKQERQRLFRFGVRFVSSFGYAGLLHRENTRYK